MPGFIARKLCPELIFVPVDFEKYTHYSLLTRKVFQRYDQNFIAASLDEAYLDITKVCGERDMSSDDVAEELRRGVLEETGLTCSAGVGPNRLLSKVCSDINKPNGQFILPNDRMAVMTFISSLPIRKVGGIGKVTEHILRDVFEITTCQELLQKGGFLCAFFSQSSADFFLSVGLGLGSTNAPQARLRKSMSNERTFPATKDERFLYQKLAELAEMLSSDLQKEELHGRNLSLKLKTASFEVRSRAVTLQKHICSSEDILRHAKKLLKAELPASLRLMGLRVSQFSEDNIGPSDPSQKSITNFMIFGDASGSNTHGRDSLRLKDIDVVNHFTDDFASYDHISDCSHLDAFTSDQLSDLGCISEHTADLNGNVDPPSDSQAGESAPASIMQVSKLHKPDVCQSSRTKLPVPDCISSGTSSGYANARDDGSVLSSSLQVQFQWVDDYKCSICGIEMPPEFVYERQEHSDFHLAERLQEDCSSSRLTNQSSNTPKRVIQTDQNASPAGQKRRKSEAEQGKFLPIDKFFKKRTQDM